MRQGHQSMCLKAAGGVVWLATGFQEPAFRQMCTPRVSHHTLRSSTAVFEHGTPQQPQLERTCPTTPCPPSTKQRKNSSMPGMLRLTAAESASSHGLKLPSNVHVGRSRSASGQRLLPRPAKVLCTRPGCALFHAHHMSSVTAQHSQTNLRSTLPFPSQTHCVRSVLQLRGVRMHRPRSRLDPGETCLLSSRTDLHPDTQLIPPAIACLAQRRESQLAASRPAKLRLCVPSTAPSL